MTTIPTTDPLLALSSLGALAILLAVATLTRRILRSV